MSLSASACYTIHPRARIIARAAQAQAQTLPHAYAYAYARIRTPAATPWNLPRAVAQIPHGSARAGVGRAAWQG
eukprot:5688026-Alexandrium_andersonii.AAC.1